MQVRLWDICVHDWARGELGFPPLAGEVGNGLDASVVQSCLFLWPHELWPTRLLCPWGLPGKNIGVGCRALLQGIFLTQGSNLSLLHLLQWQEDFLPLSHLGSPWCSGLQIHSFHRWGEWGQKDWPRFLKATQLVSGRANLLCWPPVEWDKIRFRLALCFFIFFFYFLFFLNFILFLNFT